jgi:hypothetical protein
LPVPALPTWPNILFSLPSHLSTEISSLNFNPFSHSFRNPKKWVSKLACYLILIEQKSTCHDKKALLHPFNLLSTFSTTRCPSGNHKYFKGQQPTTHP